VALLHLAGSLERSGPVQAVRLGLQSAIRSTVAGGRTPVRDLTQPVSGDVGLFGPGSVTWRVHSDSAMFVGGVRALFLQALHPLAMAGVAEHSDFRTDPLGRLANTAHYVGVTTYGTTAEAEQMIAIVKRVHQRVTGVAPDGRPYSANDPHLLTWVQHALIDSFLRSYQRYGAAPLTPDEADRYVAEQAVIAERFGCDTVVTSLAELRDWLRAERSELRAGPQARATARFLLAPPLPLAARPPYGILASAAIDLLPRWARRQLWLPLPPLVAPLAVVPAARSMCRAIDWAISA